MKKDAWKDIPGMFDFQSIYSDAVDAAKDEAVFVELGVFLGRSAAYMAEKIALSGKDIEFLAVDPWIITPHYLQLIMLVGKQLKIDLMQAIRERSGPADHPNFYLACRAYLEEAGCSKYVDLVRSGSHAYSYAIEKKSVDFVFVDGDHSFRGCLGDLQHWWPKLKPGGVMAGHDYEAKHPHVTRAVKTFFTKRSDIEKVGSRSWRVTKPCTTK